MPHIGEGPEEFGEFKGPLQASLRALRGRRAEERVNLARATSRVRTSGVRFIPQRTLEAGAAAREEGIFSRFGLQAAFSRIQDRRLREQRLFEREQLERGFGLRAGLSRTLARRQLQSQLIGGAISAGTTLLSRGIGGGR